MTRSLAALTFCALVFSPGLALADLPTGPSPRPHDEQPVAEPSDEEPAPPVLETTRSEDDAKAEDAKDQASDAPDEAKADKKGDDKKADDKKAGDKKADKQAAKKLQAAQTQLAGLKGELASLTQKVADLEADPELSKLADAHPNIGVDAIGETAKLHAGDAENRRHPGHPCHPHQHHEHGGDHHLERVAEDGEGADHSAVDRTPPRR